VKVLAQDAPGGNRRVSSSWATSTPGTVGRRLGPGVNEFEIGERVAVEVHKGCDRCENCIKGWYTSCLNYGDLAKGHRAERVLNLRRRLRRVRRQSYQHTLTLPVAPTILTLEQALPW